MILHLWEKTSRTGCQHSTQPIVSGARLPESLGIQTNQEKEHSPCGLLSQQTQGQSWDKQQGVASEVTVLIPTPTPRSCTGLSLIVHTGRHGDPSKWRWGGGARPLTACSVLVPALALSLCAPGLAPGLPLVFSASAPGALTAWTPGLFTVRRPCAKGGTRQ